MRQRNKERGTVTLELAASIPLIAIMLLLMVQVSVVMLDQLAVTQVAREAARAAAVDPSPRVAEAAGRNATALHGDRLKISIGPRPAGDGLVHVKVTYKSQISLPFRTLTMTPEVSATAAMAVESQ